MTTLSIGLTRLDGHPSSGVYPRKDVRSWGAGKKPRRRRSFTPEFKAEIVELYRQGDLSAGQVPRDFDLTETAVREWGRHREALTTQEAVSVFRGLARTNPAVHRADLARALINCGTGLGRLGQDQEALITVQEAVTTYRSLTGDNPAVHQAALAMALTNLGNDLDRFRQASGGAGRGPRR